MAFLFEYIHPGPASGWVLLLFFDLHPYFSFLFIHIFTPLSFHFFSFLFSFIFHFFRVPC